MSDLIIPQPGRAQFDKNRHGKYTSVDEVFAEAAGEDSPENCIGKTDDQLVWKFSGNTCNRSDWKVISGNPFSKSREWIKTAFNWKEVIAVKNQSALGGVSGSLILTESLESPMLNEFSKQQSVYVPEINDRLNWNWLMALRCVLRGQPIRDIATQLSKSERTIKGYIEDVKKKFGATSKADLITMLHCCGVAVLVNVIEDHQLWKQNDQTIIQPDREIVEELPSGRIN